MNNRNTTQIITEVVDRIAINPPITADETIGMNSSFETTGNSVGTIVDSNYFLQRREAKILLKTQREEATIPPIDANFPPIPNIQENISGIIDNSADALMLMSNINNHIANGPVRHFDTLSWWQRMLVNNYENRIHSTNTAINQNSDNIAASISRSHDITISRLTNNNHVTHQNTRLLETMRDLQRSLEENAANAVDIPLSSLETENSLFYYFTTYSLDTINYLLGLYANTGGNRHYLVVMISIFNVLGPIIYSMFYNNISFYSSSAVTWYTFIGSTLTSARNQVIGVVAPTFSLLRFLLLNTWIVRIGVSIQWDSLLVEGVSFLRTSIVGVRSYLINLIIFLPNATIFRILISYSMYSAGILNATEFYNHLRDIIFSRAPQEPGLINRAIAYISRRISNWFN